jgi:hypothetical protein
VQFLASAGVSGAPACNLKVFLVDAGTSEPDIHHIVISCNQNGGMIVESANKPQVFTACLSDAVNDRGLAMTSSFSNMVIFGQCLAHQADLDAYEPVVLKLVAAREISCILPLIVRQHWRRRNTGRLVLSRRVR